MSTNEANIKITVDDSDLVTTDNRLERVEDGLQGVARGGRQANASLQGVGKAALGAVGGLVSMELAKRALTGAINGLRASIQAFADTNERGQQTVDEITASFTSMKAALGQAMIGGENAEQVVDSLNETFDVLRQYIDDNSEAIAELTVDSLEVFATTVESTIVLVDDLRVIFAGLNEVLNDSESALGKVIGVLQRAESTLNMTGRAFEFLRDRAEEALPPIEAGESRFMHVEAAADNASASILAYASSLVEAARISSQVFGSASNIGVPEPPRRSRGRRDDEGSNQQQLLVQRREFNNNMAALFAELEVQRQASKNLTAQNQLDQQAKEIDAKKQFLLQMATMEDEALAARLAAQQQQAQELNALREKQTAVATSAATSLQKTLLAVSAGTAKERKAALKKALGQELVQRGGALVAQGIGNLIALNPKGAFEIAGGASMVAAGAKLAGGGGGGRGGSPASNTTPPAATSNTTNVTYNQTTQFGFVGDRRAATREIEEINRRSVDRGL